MAVTVAMTFTIFLAVAALVTDGGALGNEHSQLQNGADAGALAMARACAVKDATCGSTTYLQQFLDANADDGRSSGTFSFGTDTVTVTARTLDAKSGMASIPYALAGAIGVSGGYTRATASASWVPRVRDYFVPIPITRCEFDDWTDSSQTTRYRWKGTQRLATITFAGGTDPCGDVPDGLSAVGKHLGRFTVETKCIPPSGCSEDELEPHLGDEVVLSVWSPAGSTWKFDGFAGFYLDSFYRNNGHQIGSTTCRVHDCISGTFSRTSRRDGRPENEFLLGGQVDLTG